MTEFAQQPGYINS